MSQQPGQFGWRQPQQETWVDRQIREAQERGEFDNLPGAGKPLGDLGDPNDSEWWVRRYIEREKLDVSGALPSPLVLRKEAASFPGLSRSTSGPRPTCARSSRTTTTA